MRWGNIFDTDATSPYEGAPLKMLLTVHKASSLFLIIKFMIEVELLKDQNPFVLWMKLFRNRTVNCYVVINVTCHNTRKTTEQGFVSAAE